MPISKFRSTIVGALVGALALSPFAVNANAAVLDSQCKVTAGVPTSDGNFAKTTGTISCSVSIAEKAGGQVQRWGIIQWYDLGQMKYSPASAGTKTITSPIATSNCNGRGTESYRGKAWGRTTNETTAVVYSSDKKLTC